MCTAKTSRVALVTGGTRALKATAAAATLSLTLESTLAEFAGFLVQSEDAMLFRTSVITSSTGNTPVSIGG